MRPPPPPTTSLSAFGWSYRYRRLGGVLKPGNLNGSRVCVIPSLGKFLQLVVRGSVRPRPRACPWSLGPGPWALGPLGPCPWSLGPWALAPGPLGPCPWSLGPWALVPWALGPCPWALGPLGPGSRIRTVPLVPLRPLPPTSLSAFRVVLSVFVVTVWIYAYSVNSTM